MNHKYIIQNVLICLLISTALGTLFFMMFEKQTVDRISTPSAEARQNPFLAAHRFLTQSGFNSECTSKRDTLIHLPPLSNIIFVSSFGGNLPMERENALMSWIEDGGSLVLTHTKPWDDTLQKSGNTFFDRLGIRRLHAKDLEQMAKDTEPDTPESNFQSGIDDKTKDHASPMPKTEIIDIAFHDHPAAQIEFYTDRVLFDTNAPPSTNQTGPYGSHVIIKSLGKGRLIVLSDNHWMTNKGIGQNDHAYALSQLVKGHEKIWIMHTLTLPSLFMLIVNRVPHMLVCFIVLCFMFFFWFTRFIGPRYPAIDIKHRNISEHLLAAGFFTLKHASAQTLIHKTRSVIYKNIRSKPSLSHKKSMARQQEELARLTNLTNNEIKRALHDPVKSKEAFIEATLSLQKIHRHIHKNPHKTEKL